MDDIGTEVTVVTLCRCCERVLREKKEKWHILEVLRQKKHDPESIFETLQDSLTKVPVVGYRHIVLSRDVCGTC